ncbi:hypothetical protein CAPTEDRAFT_167605 [Capitella teleta]|uniref:Alpha N-terminal protein methyltransferase 1 n=1 Tax=Capitella teleta TaxID=283909 RepID=X1ZB40_CAPTE|nr:hypothetical protein CAPTEDRAFT_167605 [Capitella teleta]|eukprot:ELU10174.1 hypothetical protein CAPTEDRAFT_167605 [Capitella teleta]
MADQLLSSNADTVTGAVEVSDSPADCGKPDAANQDPFYGNAKDYWAGIPATVDGMLGGFSHISSTDVAGSTKFLRRFVSGAGAKTSKNRALDCGAGIGRVTKMLLLPLFKCVDMVELTQSLLDEAPKYLGEDNAKRVERFICSGLQDFSPEPNRYDVIWSQWVLGHLTDEDLVEFFKRCKVGLTPNGLICVKENIAPTDEAEFDEKDSSWCRGRGALAQIFEAAGLKIVREEKQKHFPKSIYEVRIFALQ